MAVQRPKNLRITDLRIHGISSHLASVRPFEECQAKKQKETETRSLPDSVATVQSGFVTGRKGGVSYRKIRP